MKKVEPAYHSLGTAYVIKHDKTGEYVCLDNDTLLLFYGKYGESTVKFTHWIEAGKYADRCESGEYADCNLDAKDWTIVSVMDMIPFYP